MNGINFNLPKQINRNKVDFDVAISLLEDKLRKRCKQYRVPNKSLEEMMAIATHAIHRYWDDYKNFAQHSDKGAEYYFINVVATRALVTEMIKQARVKSLAKKARSTNP